MKFIIASFLCFTLVFSGFSQSRSVVGPPVSNNFMNASNAPFWNHLMDRSTKGYASDGLMDGSPFLYEQWREAYVEYKGNLFQFDQVKYNVYENALEINKDGQVYLLDNFHFDRFLLSDLSGNFIEFKSGKNSPQERQ